MIGKAHGNERYDAGLPFGVQGRQGVNLTPRLTPQPQQTWPLQVVNYQQAGPGAGVHVAPRPQPYRLTTYTGPSAPKPGRLRPF